MITFQGRLFVRRHAWKESRTRGAHQFRKGKRIYEKQTRHNIKKKNQSLLSTDIEQWVIFFLSPGFRILIMQP